MSEAVSMAPRETDRLLQVTMGLWFGLLFIQPFEKFVAVKYLLMVGLLLWLFLMLRCTVNAFREKGTDKNLLAIFVAK